MINVAAFMAISIFSSVKIPTPEVTYAFLMPLPVATKIPSNPIENCDDMLQTIHRLVGPFSLLNVIPVVNFLTHNSHAVLCS